MQKGVTVSDLIPPEAHASGQMRSEVRFHVGVRDNPVEAAEMRYIREHGATGLSAIETLIYDLFPPQSQVRHSDWVYSNWVDSIS